MKMGLVLLLGLNAWAASPPDLGNYAGILMTGAVISHPVKIQGGHLTGCVTSGQPGSEIHKCNVEDALTSVALNGSSVDYLFSKVNVIQASANSFAYYYFGSRTLKVNGRDIVQPLRMTVGLNAKDKTKVSGFLDLTETDARSAFEVFRE